MKGKAALRQGQAAVLPTGHQLLRQRQGQRVLCKGLGGVAVDVARELVEHPMSVFKSRTAL